MARTNTTSGRTSDPNNDTSNSSRNRAPAKRASSARALPAIQPPIEKRAARTSNTQAERECEVLVDPPLPCPEVNQRSELASQLKLRKPSESSRISKFPDRQTVPGINPYLSTRCRGGTDMLEKKLQRGNQVSLLPLLT